jgi:AcrR family transcriptional regulator
MASQRERVNQKRRTREALVQAARDLLAQGQTPTVADVADEALVSRATAYRYFRSQEHLLLEVVLERSIDEIDRDVKAAASSDQLDERVDGIVRAVQAEIAANAAGFRGLLVLSLHQSGTGDEASIAAIRGERRVHWIEHALAPLHSDLDEESFQRLVSALTLCLGAEPHFVLSDVRGLENDEIVETLRWTAHVLVSAATSENRLPDR